MEPTESSATTIEPFRIHSNRKRSGWLAGLILGFGLLSVFLYIDILLKLRSYYTLFVVVPLYAYVFGDAAVWMRSGVRSVELDASGLNIIRTNRQPVQHIGKSEIQSVVVTSTLDGKAVDVLLRGAESKKFLWIQYTSGPHVRISQMAFDKGEFAELIRRVTTLAVLSRRV